MSSVSDENRTEHLADYFVKYLFDEYKGTRHVRRVATWIGFLLKSIERVAGDSLDKNRTRQVVFNYAGRKFKVRYHHATGRRGGIQIVEVLPGRGSPEGDVAVQIRNLSEAEKIYKNLEKLLDNFVNK